MGLQKLFESFYLDLTPRDALRVSQYTILLDQLRAAEQAKKTHDQMMVRTGEIHARNVKKAREALEAEADRLRRAVDVTKAIG